MEGDDSLKLENGIKESIFFILVCEMNRVNEGGLQYFRFFFSNQTVLFQLSHLWLIPSQH